MLGRKTRARGRLDRLGGVTFRLKLVIVAESLGAHSDVRTKVLSQRYAFRLAG